MDFEKQIVKINLDNYKSHRPGVLPYIRYNSENTAIETVSNSAYNGNYGQFVCDLSSTTFSVRYMDIISRYNEMQKMLSESVFAKKADRMVVNEQAKKCGYPNQSSTKRDTCLVRIPRYPLSAYDFVPVSSSMFTNEGDFYYLKSGSGTLRQDRDLFVILPDYERYSEIEDWWEAKAVSGTTPDTDFSFCRFVEDNFLGLITIPEKDSQNRDIDGLRVPSTVYKQEIPEILKWFNENSKNGDPETIQAINERGGEVFKNFVAQQMSTSDWRQKTDITYTAPSVRIHTILTQECDYGGVYENYNDSMTAFEGAEVTKYLQTFHPRDSKGQDITQLNGWWEKGESGTSISSESRLSDVMSKKSVNINGVIGVWVECNKIYTARYRTGLDYLSIPEDTLFVISAGTMDDMSWWEFTETNTRNKTLYCDDGGDGTGSTNSKIYYRTIPTFACVNELFKTAPADNDIYYFLVKKDNGGLKKPTDSYPLSGCAVTRLKIPFVEHAFSDIREVEPNIYSCNYVARLAENDDDSLTIEYVIGGRATKNNSGYTYIERTGTRYKETFGYHKNQVMLTDLDSYHDVNVYYDELDIEGAKVKIINTDYNLERMGNVAEIIGMEVGSMFTNENTIAAPVFDRDGVGSLMEEPKVKFNLIIDRGAAAAFERHFKLGECNSFEDLQNYGNNYFNL